MIALALADHGGDDEFGSTAFHVVFLVAAWLLGDAIGSRRAYVREIEEKAERLERERRQEAARVVAEEQARIAPGAARRRRARAQRDRRAGGRGRGGLRARSGARAAADPRDRHGGTSRAHRPTPRARGPARRRRLRAATGARAARRADRPGARDRARRGARDRGRAEAAARDGRPLRLPDHPGGADEHAQARRRAGTRRSAFATATTFGCRSATTGAATQPGAARATA